MLLIYIVQAVHPHKLVRLIFGQRKIFCQTATPQWSMGSQELSNGTTFAAIGAAVAEFKWNNLISATLFYLYRLAVHPQKLLRLIFGQREIFCQTATPQ